MLTHGREGTIGASVLAARAGCGVLHNESDRNGAQVSSTRNSAPRAESNANQALNLTAQNLLVASGASLWIGASEFGRGNL
jgi:hypothetical protein